MAKFDLSLAGNELLGEITGGGGGTGDLNAADLDNAATSWDITELQEKYKAGDQTKTFTGTSACTLYWFQIGSQDLSDVQLISGIKLYCRPTLQDVNTTSPFYLGIWQEQNNKWVRVATSLNTQTQSNGGTLDFNFLPTPISGNMRFCPLPQRFSKWPDTPSLRLGLLVVSSGVTDTNTFVRTDLSVSTNPKYRPKIDIEYATKAEFAIESSGSSGGTTLPAGNNFMSPVIGSSAQGTGQDGIAVGRLSNASGDISLALGYEATASGSDSIAIGDNAVAAALNSVAIGFLANNKYSNSVLLQTGQTNKLYFYGPESDLATKTNSKAGMAYYTGLGSNLNDFTYISFEDLFSKSGSSSSDATLPAGNSLLYPVIGQGASSEMTTNIVIGQNAVSTGGHYNVLIGQESNNTQGYNTTIGYGIKGAAAASVIIGAMATSTASETVVIGKDASTKYAGSIVAGASASVTGDNGIAIGYNAEAARQAIAIGSNTNVTAGQITINGSGNSINIGDGLIKLQSDNLTLYFFKTGSTLATENTNGEAGMGFKCGEKSGCIELSSLLTKPFTLPS